MIILAQYNIKILRELLKDFHNITKIRITIFDDKFHEIVSFPEELPEYCMRIRHEPQLHAKCIACDQNSCEIASKRNEPYIYRCHMDLTEAITPLYLGGITIGYLLFGHINNEATPPSLDSDLIHSFYELTKADEAYIYSASKIMETLAVYLCLKRIADLKQDTLSVRIDRYVSDNISNPLSNAIICNAFSISRTSLYHLSLDMYGMGIMEHVKKERLELARKLLLESDMPIAMVSFQCGITDYNFFSKMFRKEFGMTPSNYRKQRV